MTQQQLDQFLRQYAEKGRRSETSLEEAIVKIKVPTKDFTKAFVSGMQEIKQGAGRRREASPPLRLPRSCPTPSPTPRVGRCGSSACSSWPPASASSSRDGLWSNAIRLVNVVFAGLLAMNFYEPLANWLTKLQRDLPSLRLLARFPLAVDLFHSLRGGFPRRHRCGFQGPHAVLEDRRFLGRRRVVGVHRLGHARFHARLAARRPAGAISPVRIIPAPKQHVLRHARPGPRVAGLHQVPVVGDPIADRCEQDMQFPADFIEKQLERRMHVEKYIIGNKDQPSSSIRNDDPTKSRDAPPPPPPRSAPQPKPAMQPTRLHVRQAGRLHHEAIRASRKWV